MTKKELLDRLHSIYGILECCLAHEYAEAAREAANIIAEIDSEKKVDDDR